MAPDFPEKRKHPRHICEGGVEVRQEGSPSFWGTLCDISLGGCYVQTFSPLPAGTSVHLVVKAKDVEIHMDARVASTHPGVGMGLFFAQIVESEVNKLANLLTTLEAAEQKKPGDIILM